VKIGDRTYDSCRYVERSGPAPEDVDTVWYHVGTGFTLRSDSGNGRYVVELQSGTLDGDPLQ
jgi:hypothetical protein